jgi:pimeloyl-ACP methyl ester carboxylesterase
MGTIIKRVYFFLISILLTYGLSGQEYISSEFLTSYDRDFVIDNFGIPATNGVDLYKIRYTSVDLEGMPDTLSGLIGIPQTENLVHPLMLYAHGTVGSRESVPSRLSSEHSLIVIFGSLGYFSLAPDYLGLGDSQGVHPYVHADSEASACYDMIKAIRTSAAENDFLINDQNFIFGYSQGGHAAMALHRYMEIENPDGYEVTAAAPSSGPYSISEEMRDFTLGDNEYFFVAYLASVAISYQAAYKNILTEEGLSSFFKDEYAVEMEKYKDEEIDLFELNSRLINLLIQNHGKSLPKLMLRENALNDILNNPDSPIAKALAANDVYDWAPKAPTRLLYCKGDDQVVYTNSIVAEAKMKANGAEQVASLDMGTELTHTQCVPGAVNLAIFFFDSYKDVSSSIFTPELNHDYELFPNPAHDMVVIRNKSGYTTTGKITIMDISGRIITTRNAATNEPIAIDGLNMGQYLVMWETNKSVEVHRLIIAH